MTTSQGALSDLTLSRRCGCCGRDLARRRLAELGVTPGVYICRGCALWAARRAHGPISWPGLRSLRLRRRRHPDVAQRAVPILASQDLHRTERFYAGLGFEVVGRYPGYLLLSHGTVELHFTEQANRVLESECFIHVTDATAYWKQLMANRVEGVAPPDDKDYGLTEFVVQDPDGNTIRFGSPT